MMGREPVGLELEMIASITRLQDRTHELWVQRNDLLEAAKALLVRLDSQLDTSENDELSQAIDDMISPEIIRLRTAVIAVGGNMAAAGDEWDEVEPPSHHDDFYHSAEYWEATSENEL